MKKLIFFILCMTEYTGVYWIAGKITHMPLNAEGILIAYIAANVIAAYEANRHR